MKNCIFCDILVGMECSSTLVLGSPRGEVVRRKSVSGMVQLLSFLNGDFPLRTLAGLLLPIVKSLGFRLVVPTFWSLDSWMLKDFCTFAKLSILNLMYINALHMCLCINFSSILICCFDISKFMSNMQLKITVMYFLQNANI